MRRRDVGGRGAPPLTRRYTIEPHSGATFERLHWSPDGRFLAACTDGMVRLWHMVDLRELTPFVIDEKESYGFSMAWSPDSTRVASISRRGVIQIWSRSTGAIGRQFKLDIPK